MSFFSFIEKTFNKASELFNNFTDKAEHYESIHYNKSTEELLKIKKSGPGGLAERTAARKILKDRGHDV